MQVQGAHPGDRLPMALGVGLGTGTPAALLAPVWRSIDPNTHQQRGEKINLHWEEKILFSKTELYENTVD